MPDIHEAAGSYAMDALDEADLVEFEAHLASCPACQEEIVTLRETATDLSLLSLATPPPSLRDNVMAAIRSTPQVRPVNGAVRTAPPGAPNGSQPLGELSRAVASSGPRRAARPQPPADAG